MKRIKTDQWIQRLLSTLRRHVCSFVCVNFLITTAFAQTAFVINNIQVEGLQRTSQATVESYLPVHRGQTLRPAQTADIVRALYGTGFFDSVNLSRTGNTLIIHVVERPTIGQLKIVGNSLIPTDKLTPIMNDMNIAEGRIYNPGMLAKIKQGLLNQYYQLGHYNARVDIRVTPMSRGRVAVKIDISEGVTAKIQRISIIGNHAFDESTLVKHLEMTTSGLFTFFTQTDRYSEEKLQASLDTLRAFYLDHGYLHIEIKSAQGEISPDRKSVYVTIVLSEGEPYTIEKWAVDGTLILPRTTYDKLINITPGETFSRQKVIEAEKAVTSALGDKGYLFATVNLRPRINEKNHSVTLLFTVNPGKRTYVHHVTFSDNTRTNDVVLRREVTQMESAPASSTRLEESKHRLSLLAFIKDVDMSVKPREESADQVDVNYKVKEDNSATASFKVGYSQIQRVILGAGLNQKNVFGTGNTLGINLQRSRFQQYYGIDFTDPYYTPDGISRSFNFAISRMDPAGAGVNVGYTTYEYDAGVLYSIPVGQEQGVFNRIETGVGYQNILVNLIPKYLSNQVNDFITSHGTHFQQADFKIGFSRNSLDKAMFPTRGGLQTLFFDGFAPLSSGSTTFYTVNYAGKWYQPLTDQFVVLAKGNIGYGSGFHTARDFPFFKNYYTGGIDSVRGYRGFTLGPRDSSGNPFGGNALTTASLALIFPNFITDNLRTSVFVDAGNVYSTAGNRSFGGQSTDAGPIRYSSGLEGDLLTPFGPIEVSLAARLNKRPHDDAEAFQFAMGTSF
ncbi:MAG TPA: outer membrane protein assembly factor BamA [Gammaproteobacteria bacterium]|jgi:outer membrane protein insertion porin family|nr:outer membrane protein assembly factor BamA [Gammaproteobacteria bacterium]